MEGMLVGIKVALLGGDAREVVLLKELLKLGAEVRTAGLPAQQEQKNYECHQDPLAALKGAMVVIFPVAGVNHEGKIYAPDSRSFLYLTEEMAGVIPQKTPVLVGVARQFLKQKATRYGWQLVETADIDEMAILNSIPTAEGAVMLAMQEMPVTLHGSEVFVLGLGRTGFTLCKVLSGIGANVTVVDRGEADRATASIFGWQAYSFNELSLYAGKADVVFNTVPSMVLTKEILEKTQKDVLIIDLASAPGGTDFAAAEALGRRAILAPGLPGKVAPKTAGYILARIYPPLILKCLGRQ